MRRWWGHHRYTLSFVTVLFSTVIRQVLDDYLLEFPFVTYHPAVLLTAALGGVGPGFVTLVLSAFLGWLFFLPSPRSFGLGLMDSDVLLALFSAYGIAMIWLASAFRRACEVAESNAQLAGVNAELAEERRLKAEEASAVKTRFVAGVAHEFRTPLNAIAGFSQLLLEEPLEAKHQRFAQHIHRAAKHLELLVNDTLDLSIIEAQGPKLQPEQFLAGVAIDEVLCGIEHLAQTKDISIRKRIAEGAVLYMDRGRFEQVIYNLLTNALKFTGESGQILVEAQESRTQRTVVVIEDTGIGIALEDQPAIFDLFYRGQGHAPLIEGTGLGLAISKRLVEDSGGRIWFESEVGKGTRFFVELPARVPLPLNSDESRSGAHHGKPENQSIIYH